MEIKWKNETWQIIEIENALNGLYAANIKRKDIKIENDSIILPTKNGLKTYNINDWIKIENGKVICK